MSEAPHGWIRVWIPERMRALGGWVVRAGEHVGAHAQAIPAGPSQQKVRIEGRGVFGPGQFALALELEVYVEPARITEIHVPPYVLR